MSSGAISESRRLSASSATLRNIMAKLELMGYLAQPHTSAGRIPTDRGLRFYVGRLLADEPLPEERVPVIQEEFPNRTADLDSLLLQACRLLADTSDALGFVISPRIFRLPFEHLRLIKISDRRVLIILVTPFHMVLTETLDSALPLAQADLDRAPQYISQNYRGKTLQAVSEALSRDLPRYRMKAEDYENFREQLVALMEYFDGEKVYILDLPANLIPHPEVRRRMVDPELVNTPVNKALLANAQAFNSFYQLTEKISELLEQGREVFIYTIDVVRTYDPMNFDPTFRPIIRDNSIELDYWYNPQYIEQVNEPIQPEQYFERYPNIQREEKLDKPKSIGDSKLIHKF